MAFDFKKEYKEFPYEYPKVDTPFFGEKKAADTFSAGTLFGRA